MRKTIGITRAGSKLMVLQSLMSMTPSPAAAINTPPTIEVSVMSSSEMKVSEIFAMKKKKLCHKNTNTAVSAIQIP